MTAILLAEDDPAVREGLAALLESEGYAVRAAADGAAAVAEFDRCRPDLALLDVMMPRMDGFAVCAAIRARDAAVPVLFLTAKDAVAMEVRGLAAGADDFISKTAPGPVLLARIAAALARVRRQEGAPADDFVFAGCRVDAHAHRLVDPQGAYVDLTPREIEMLRFFGRHPGAVCTRDDLLTEFWGHGVDAADVTLSVAMRRLRAKLGPLGECLETVYGYGYRFTHVPENAADEAARRRG